MGVQREDKCGKIGNCRVVGGCEVIEWYYRGLLQRVGEDRLGLGMVDYNVRLRLILAELWNKSDGS